MHSDNDMPHSDNRRLLLKGLTVSVASAFTTACGGGGGAGGSTGSVSTGTGATGGSTTTAESGTASGSGVVAVTPSLFPTNGKAQFFTASSGGATNAPFCIGQAFKRGEIAAGADIVTNDITNFQAVVKNRWPDGSVKFAILAGRMTLAAGASKVVSLTKGKAGTAQVLAESDLVAANPDLTIQFDSVGSVKLADLLGKTSSYNSATKVWSPGRITQWVSGPQMSSWIYHAHVGSSAHLVAWFEVRLFQGGIVQVLPWIENGYLKVAGPTSQNGIASVVSGTATLFSWSFTGANVLPHHCRAPLVPAGSNGYWLGGAAPDLSVTHDTVYLQQTLVVPAYFAATSSQSPIWAHYATGYAPQAQLNYSDAMSGTGYAPAIGLVPEWDALYFTSRGDIRAQQAMYAHGMAAGRFSIHYRDETTAQPIKFSSYPNLVTNPSNSSITGVGDSTSGDYTPAPLANGGPEWDVAHHPSIGFAAYLSSGAFYFLEELQFAAGTNYLFHHSAYRHADKGIFETTHMTTRGAAWAIRTLTQAACLTPDDHPLRAEYVRSLDENINYYYGKYIAQSSCPLGVCAPYSDYTTDNNGADNDGIYTHAMWMEDFLTAVTGYAYVSELSGSTATRANHRAFFEWKAKSVVGRLAKIDDPTGWPLVDACRYYLAVSPANTDWSAGTGPWYGDWRTAYNAHKTILAAGDPMAQAPANALRGGYYPDATSYWGNFLPAVAYAVDLGAAGAADAYTRLTSADNWLDILDSSNDSPVWSVRPINGSRAAPYTYPAKLSETAMPVWRNGQAVNSWREISGSSMSQLPAPPSSLTALSYTGPSAKINAWCGLALDNRNGTVYSAANGGHMDYAGNEVDSINLLSDAPKWTERLAPSYADKVVANATYYADGTPSSRHSYYAHFFVEQRNRAMHFYNGVPFGVGKGGAWVVDGFNPGTNRWDRQGTYTKASILELPLGSPVTLDPATGNAYVFPSDSYAVWMWNQESNAWSRLANNIPNFHSYYAASALDTKRRCILLLGGTLSVTRGLNKGMVFDIASNMAVEVTLTGSGAGAFTALPGIDGSIGLVYAPELDAYIAAGDTTSAGGVTVFVIDASSFVVTALNTGTTGNSMPSCGNMIFTRFMWVPKLGGVVYYPAYSGNMWFLRLV